MLSDGYGIYPVLPMLGFTTDYDLLHPSTYTSGKCKQGIGRVRFRKSFFLTRNKHKIVMAALTQALEFVCP
jgi:hypothetical protein